MILAAGKDRQARPDGAVPDAWQKEGGNALLAGRTDNVQPLTAGTRFLMRSNQF